MSKCPNIGVRVSKLNGTYDGISMHEFTAQNQDLIC